VAATNPGKLVKAALEKAVEKVTELVNPPVPGVPASETPDLAEPTTPREPLPAKRRTSGKATASKSICSRNAPSGIASKRTP
jgi:catalase